MRSTVSTLVLAACLTAIAGAQSTKQIPPPPDLKAPPAKAVKTPFVLSSMVLKPGTGKVHPTPTDTVLVHYTGWTADGKTFDTTSGGDPAEMPLNEVMVGWTEGLQLMVEGETRRFWIPEQLAYRGRRAPYGTLVFDIELVAIKK